MTSSRDPDVPRLPRGRGIKLTGPQVMRILILATVLVGVVVMMRPCADSVSRFVVGFGSGTASGSGSAPVPAPGPSTRYVEIKPGMTEQQIRDVLQGSGADSGTGSSAASGTGSSAGAASGTGSSAGAASSAGASSSADSGAANRTGSASASAPH